MPKQETNITINGTQLNKAQVMTVHVALQSFGMELEAEPDRLGVDAHGIFMTQSYLKSIREINRIYI